MLDMKELEWDEDAELWTAIKGVWHPDCKGPAKEVQRAQGWGWTEMLQHKPILDRAAAEEARKEPP